MFFVVHERQNFGTVHVVWAIVMIRVDLSNVRKESFKHNVENVVLYVRVPCVLFVVVAIHFDEAVYKFSLELPFALFRAFGKH